MTIGSVHDRGLCGTASSPPAEWHPGEAKAGILGRNSDLSLEDPIRARSCHSRATLTVHLGLNQILIVFRNNEWASNTALSLSSIYRYFSLYRSVLREFETTAVYELNQTIRAQIRM